MSLVGVAERRQVAERIAVDSLAEAGDPVALAIKAAVAHATTVEVTPTLVETFSHMYGTWETPEGMSSSEFALRTALQAAGFEVLS